MFYLDNAGESNRAHKIMEVLGRRVHRRLLLNVQDLRNALVAEWHNVAPGVIRRYVNNMRATTTCGREFVLFLLTEVAILDIKQL